MKNLLALAGLLFLTLTAFGQKGKMPDMEVKNLDGAAVNANAIYSKKGPTVVAFWATWCSPCKKELDAYAEFYEDWKEDFNAEVYAITIDNRRQLSKVRPMIESKEWDFKILSDPNEELRQLLNFQTIPHVFILDQDGNIVYSHSGYVPGDEYEIDDKLKELAEKG